MIDSNWGASSLLLVTLWVTGVTSAWAQNVGLVPLKSLPHLNAQIPVTVVPGSVMDNTQAADTIAPVAGALLQDTVPIAGTLDTIPATGSLAEKIIPSWFIPLGNDPPLLVEMQALDEVSKRKLLASACRVISAIAVNFDFGQMKTAGPYHADAAVSVMCPQGQHYRILPMQDDIPVAAFNAKLVKANGPIYQTSMLVTDRSGGPLKDGVWVGDGSVQSIEIFAYLTIPEDVPRPSVLEMPSGSQFQLLFE